MLPTSMTRLAGSMRMSVTRRPAARPVCRSTIAIEERIFRRLFGLHVVVEGLALEERAVGHVEPEGLVRRAAQPRPESVGVLRGVQRFEADRGAFERGSLRTWRRKWIENLIEQMNLSLCYPRLRVKSLSVLRAVLFLTMGVGAAVSGEIDWTIHLRSAGPVKIGMSLSEIRVALGDPHARLDGNDPDPAISPCAFLRSKAVPKNIGFMFAKGKVVRIDVNGPGILAASGAEVGDSEEKIKRLYPKGITVTPHKYLETGHYLNYSPAEDSDRDYGMVFETDKNKVTSFRTGTIAAIALVEGCG